MEPMVWTFNDVNVAYYELMNAFSMFSEWEETRNGRAQVMQAPVLIAHATPYRRVLFDPVRDANPFFHYMEAIWMLSGSATVAFPAKFARNIASYSDDGISLHGAYGWRWRMHFGKDQIDAVVQMLKKDPNTRRAVIAMWSPFVDLEVDSKDLPCNTHLYFRRTAGRLDMTVCNRSNDLVWGMLGANIVHFSILHEYVAACVGMDMGVYYQFTNNLHMYEGFNKKYHFTDDRWYNRPVVSAIRFGPETLSMDEAQRFVEDMGEVEFSDEWASPILVQNACPMMESWNAYKGGNIHRAIHLAGNIHDDDWSRACVMWLTRRIKNEEDKEG